MILAKVLIDNRRQDDRFAVEHGFSLYVEMPNHKCLVDVGLSDAFLSNAEQMGVDIADVDYLFLSHGHADHVGGLSFFLQKNIKAKVVVSASAFRQKYYSTRRGLKDISPVLKLEGFEHRFRFISENTDIEDDIHVVLPTVRQYAMPLGNEFLWKDEGLGRVKDDFNHELIFCFGKDELMVCSGCAHNGLVNILESVKAVNLAKISSVIGGFHLLDVDDMSQYESAEEISEVANLLDENYPETKFYTGHCTGDKPFMNMKKVMGDRLQQFYVGKEIECKFN